MTDDQAEVIATQLTLIVTILQRMLDEIVALRQRAATSTTPR